jgi:hypothetical protein
VSARERLDEDIRCVKEFLYRVQHGLCAYCKQPLAGHWELGHRIPQRKWCIEKYGADVIHHWMNQGLVCPDGCNARIQLDPISLAAKDLAAKIKDRILEEAR